jgi:hypothetical protein
LTLIYDIPIAGQLRQGEILENIWEHRSEYHSGAPDGSQIKVHSIHHNLTIIVNPGCDLEQDFKKARFPGNTIGAIDSYKDSDHPNWIPHVLLFDLYDANQIRQRFSKQDEESTVALWTTVKSNDHKRYHWLPSAQIGSANPPSRTLPNLIVDFKKPIGIPCVSLYESIRTNKINRVAIVPVFYLQEMIQRLYSFLSRIGIP